MSERVFTFPTYDLAQSILGQHNRYLQMMNEVIPADIVSRGDTVVIKGDELQVEALYRTLEELVFLYKEGSTITESQVRIAAKMVMNGKGDALHSMFEDTLSVTMRGKSITPKTEGQKQYVDSIRKNTITFGIGPAGTGKTFLAVALAAFYLKNRNVDKIILTRPAVEAGGSYLANYKIRWIHICVRFMMRCTKCLVLNKYNALWNGAQSRWHH